MTLKEIEEFEKGQKIYFNKFIDLFFEHFGKYYNNLEYYLQIYLDDYFVVRDDYTERKSFKKRITKYSMKEKQREVRKIVKESVKSEDLIVMFYKILLKR